MIEGIRRRLQSDFDDPRWDVDSLVETSDEELESIDSAEEEYTPLPSFPASEHKTIMGDSEYYHRFVQACIDSGGKFGDQRISMGWLRTMLAGLEGRKLGPYSVWEVEGPEAQSDSGFREPNYGDLFRNTGTSTFELP